MPKPVCPARVWQEAAFRRFATNTSGGTGLGLAIVHRLAGSDLFRRAGYRAEQVLGGRAAPWPLLASGGFRGVAPPG